MTKSSELSFKEWRELGARDWKLGIEAYLRKPENVPGCDFVRDRLNDLTIDKQKDFLYQYLAQAEWDTSGLNNDWISSLVTCVPSFALVPLERTDFPTFFHWAAPKAKLLFLDVFKIVRDAAQSDPALKRQIIETLTKKDTRGCPVLDRVILAPRPSDALDMVEALIKFHPDLVLVPGGYPLHRAASSGNLNLVITLCSQQPKVLTMRDAAGRSALNSDLSFVVDESTSRGQSMPNKYFDTAIRKYLRRRIVSLDVDEEDNIDIPDLLFGPNEKETEIGWDLSVFNQPGHDFSKLVETLQRDLRAIQLATKRKKPRPESLLPIEYFPTLAYVRFPELGPCESGSPPRREVLDVLLWLKEVKLVKEIVRIHIPDCITDPHSDSMVEESLELFHYDPLSDTADGLSIRELDWRKLDLSADILLERAHLVKNLVLYSSGNWAVIDHWFGNNGLPQLEQLRTVTIIIVKSRGLDGPRADKLVQRINEQYGSFISQRGWEFKTRIVDEKHITAVPRPFSGPSKPKIIPYMVKKLRPFLEWYKTYCGDHLDAPRTKVAILDSGIDRSLKFQGVVEGKSFVRKNGRVSPWYIASHPHGTQMAQLIRSLDPCCDLYIAKVCDDRNDIQVANVVRALKWARQMKVDVVSMSFVLRVYDSRKDSLEDEINRTKRKSKFPPNGLADDDHEVVFIASTGDLGRNRITNYPADYDKVISIAACNREGKEWTYTEEANYWIEGQNISTDRLNYITAEELISGSSISTALAAGLASSLICCRNILIKDNDDEDDIVDHIEKVDKLAYIRDCFDSFKNPDPKYMRPWISLGIDSNENVIQRWDQVDGRVKVLDMLKTVKKDADRRVSVTR